MGEMNENNDKLSIKEKLAVIKRVWGMLESADKGYFRRGFVEKLPEIISAFSGIYLASLVIDGISGGRDIKYLLTAAAVICSIELAGVLMGNINWSRKNYHDKLFEKNVEKSVWKKIMNMDYVHIENTKVQDKIARAKRMIFDYNVGMSSMKQHIMNALAGVTELIIAAVIVLPPLLSTPVTTEGFMGFIQSGWGLAAALAVCGGLEVLRSAVFPPAFYKMMHKNYADEKLLLADREIGFYMSYCMWDYQNGKDVRLYNEQELIMERAKAARQVITGGWRKAAKFSNILNAGDFSVALISNLLLYGFAIARAAGGMITPGDLIAFVLCFERIQVAVLNISSAFSGLSTGAPIWKECFELFDMPDEKYKGTIPTEKRDDNEYEFEFRHVYFKYPDSENYVLKDVCMKWRIGEKMALVGRNGCGKSTLVKLLCRLYDPTEGEITLNGIDIRKYKYEDYMALFSVVFQDSKLFSFTVGENVAADTEYDRVRATDCVTRAGFGERLAEMEKGIDTCLYKNFDEHGVEISGGEAQKLYLARAVYKGSPFIVLDEPTAALDPVSEYDIYTKFSTIVGTRTAVYISHRLSSCRFCDEITVMEEGRIAERGSHRELLENGGVYAEMWGAQAEYYKDTAGELFL